MSIARNPIAWTVGTQAVSLAAFGWLLASAPTPIEVGVSTAVQSAVLGVGALTLRNQWRRRVEAAQVRPRFGTLRLRSGVEEPVVFHPAGKAGIFIARHAGDESPVILRPGDEIEADVVGPGQSIVFGTQTPS